MFLDEEKNVQIKLTLYVRHVITVSDILMELWLENQMLDIDHEVVAIINQVKLNKSEYFKFPQNVKRRLQR